MQQNVKNINSYDYNLIFINESKFGIRWPLNKTNQTKCVGECYLTWFGLFFHISTIVGYLVSNPFYTYVLDIYDL